MSEKRLIGRIVNKHDIEANWLKATNFVPMKGEIIVYDIDDVYDYERVKIGDGAKNVNSLPFYTDAAELIHVSDIDNICGSTSISFADLNGEVRF